MMSLIFRKKLIRLKPPLQIVRLPSFDPEKNIFGSVGTKIQGGGGFMSRKNQIENKSTNNTCICIRFKLKD